MMHRSVFISLGSNMGNRLHFLSSATHQIEANEELNITKRSKVYLSRAWGVAHQRDFYNQVIQVETTLDPVLLLRWLLTIEDNLGRERIQKWHCRNIDLDLLFYDDRVYDHPELQLPHPLVTERNFVLTPMMDLAPEFVHPHLGQTIEELYLRCPDSLEVLMLETDG
jgi:2-amino-4-hydroxy-6-hydroxymethyldihydropteridine diphosphokinase